MKKFLTWEQADEFAKNAQINFKKPLSFLNNYTFDIDVVKPVIFGDNVNVNFKGKMKLIPKKFKPMIYIGQNVVYLVCDVIYEDLSMVMQDSTKRDLIDIVKSGEFGNNVLMKLFPPLYYIPKEYFNDFSKHIGLDYFNFMEDEIIFL